jgi:L-iditol 2-dehydrogenase
MKAAVLEDIGRLEVRDVEEPSIKDDMEIKIRVEACAICATDIKVYRFGHRLIKPPRIVGHELAGEVVEVGKGVKGISVGDRVAVAPAVPCGECYYCRMGMQNMCDDLTAIGYLYDGGFAEYMVVPERAVRNGCVNKIYPWISYEEAAIAEPLACVINAQELSGVGLGHTVVVLGAGPLGCLHVQLARIRGATRIILMDVSQERLDMATVSKADLYVNSSKVDPVSMIMDETDGRGADVVIVACSSKDAQVQALKMVAKRGNVNFFGGLPKDDSVIDFDSNLVHYKEFYVVGTHGSSPRHNQLALKLIGTMSVNVKGLITHRIKIEDILKGYELVESGKGMKVVVRPR